MSMTISPTRILLVQELAAALGLPRYTTKAVLTLESGCLPILEITTLVTEDDGKFAFESDQDQPQGGRAERIKDVVRKFRWVPIEE
jgi:hypothetical protein